MTAHVDKITYRASFDIVHAGANRFDVTTTVTTGGQSTYTGLTVDEVAEYFAAWSVGRQWVRP